MHRKNVSALMAILLLVACSKTPPAQKRAPSKPQSKPRCERGSVPGSPDGVCPLLLGQRIPAVQVADINGKKVDLRRAIADKPTLLIVYRGGW